LRLDGATLGTFDRVLMNPPFGKWADVEHVMHGFELLRDGGEMTAIIYDGQRARSHHYKRAAEFNAWLGERMIFDESNAPDTFVESGATGMAQTRTVCLYR